MGLYRGVGGTGDSTTDSEVNQVTADALSAKQSRDQAESFKNQTKVLADNVARSLGVEGLDAYYNELSFTGDKLTTVTTYTDSSKATTIYTKTLTYTGDLLTGVSLYEEATGHTSTKTITYDADNNISSVELS